jgi:hypothetical protein
VVSTGPESDLAPPTRDEFVAAWGDHVLSQLRPRVRAVFAVGRFVGTDGATAILALPNSAHVERATSQSEEVADALGQYFGRRIGLRLVAETDVGGPHVPAPSEAPSSSRSAGNGRDPAQPRPVTTTTTTTTTAAAATTAISPGREAPVPATTEPRVVSPGAHFGHARVVATERVADDTADEMLDPEELDLHGESVAGDALSWAQDRLMEAFPGAEEV